MLSRRARSSGLHQDVYKPVCLMNQLPTAAHKRLGCRLLVTYSDPKEAGMRLAVLDPADGRLADLDTPYTAFGALSVVPRPGGRVAVAFVGGQPTAPSEVALLEARTAPVGRRPRVFR